MKIVFPEYLYDQVIAEIKASGKNEMAAIGFTTPADVAGIDYAKMRRLCKEVWIANPLDYVERSPVKATLSPDIVIRAVAHARKNRFGVIFIHSHPHQDIPEFSAIDNYAEKFLQTLFKDRVHNCEHFSMVFGCMGIAARSLGMGEHVNVEVIGKSRHVFSNQLVDLDATDHSRYDRQMKAITTKGQDVLSKLVIAIVGLGGTGSLVAQQLVYLGVRKFILIDTDSIEDSNLNRVVGATSDCIGKPKVEIAFNMIRSVIPDAEITIIKNDICEYPVAAMLTTADFILSCTDSSGSRAVINKLAYQYIIPCIDMGSHIDVRNMVARVQGRVNFLSPGQPCLHCFENIINSERVRLELLSHENRIRDPYGLPDPEAQPAVISINSTVASLAVTMMLQVCVGLSGDVRALRYDGVDARVKEVTAERQPRCPDCANQYIGSGDLEKLMAREGT